MNKVIAVFANGGTMTTTQTALWQYDYGQILVIQGVQLPTAYEVHFCNSKDSTTITSIGDADGVVIPDQFLQNGEVIYAYVYLHTGDSDGETEYKITIPVMDRAEPTDIEPTPAQESTIGQLITALNDAVDTAEEAASKGPVIRDDYWYIWDSTAGEYVNTNVKAEGTDGENGNIIWWTTDRPTASGGNVAIPRRRLNGPEGLTPAVRDYVFGPAAGEEGEPTTLYVIISSSATVIMTALGSIVGPAGQDGYSPVVTITEITGGHRVTITDEDHPTGQSFDVMDGQGGSGSSDYDELTNKPQIAGVTLSGNKSLADLGIAAASDIPTVPVQSVNGKTGAVVLNASDVGAGTYSKPSGGIPKTDLASAVQTSLGKANTAYQKPSGGIPATDLASGVIPTVPFASSATPQALGTAAAGSSTDYSRADHKHDFNSDFVTALLQIASKVAYIGGNGQTYYDALEAALTHRTLSSISAVYTQSGTVYNSDSLDSLKTDLVVTATFSDSSTAVVAAADYTLSGTLTVGTSTITASYGGKTATFTVTVTSDPVYEVYTIGTPSISGNVLTPGNSGMIRTNRVFSPGSSPWKIRAGFTTSTFESGVMQDVVGSTDSSGASQRGVLLEGAWYSDPGVARVSAFLSGNGTSWNIVQGTLSNEIAFNTTYLVEIEFTGTQYTIRSSTDDGTTWTTISTSGSWPSAINSTTAIKGGYYLGVGLKRNGYWQGTIDLAKVKVWINGTLWWSPVLGA